MDFNKKVDSKLFRGFDWFYRLLIINLITIIFIMLPAIGPLLIWYYNTELIVFLIVGFLLGFFMFIPAFCTSFFLIKHYKEQKSGNIFVLYYRSFFLILKNLYMYEIILLPIISLLLFAAMSYWNILSPDNFPGYTFWGITAIMGFIISFFGLVLLIFTIVNIPMIVSYFRMKTKDLVKFSLYITFRYFFRSFSYTLIILFPFFLVLSSPTVFIPIYVLIGISLPLFLVYQLSEQFYLYISRNIEDIKSADKYDLKGDENENRN